MPHSKELREYFGTEGNERNEAAKASLLYDLENDLTAAAELERADGNGRELAERHIREPAGMESFKRGHEELILFDCGYPGWDMIELPEGLGIRYVMRAQRSYSREAGEGETGAQGKRPWVRYYQFRLPGGKRSCC